MSRLPPVPYADWDTEALSVLSIPGKPLPPSNVLGLMANHPDLARAFLTFNFHLLATSTISARIRELAILRIAWRRRSTYEWTQHLRIAAKVGITDAEIQEIRDGTPTLINRAVDELDGDSSLSDETYAELALTMDDRQLMDFVFTVGAYALLAVAFTTFQLELDPGLTAENLDVSK